MEDIPSLNKALKVFRTFNRLNQSDLAEKLGVTKSFISEIESGKKNVTLKLVDKYANVFSVTSSEVVALAEAYDTHEYRSSPSSIFLKLIDWISTDNADELHQKINKKGDNSSDSIGAPQYE